ncbi:MAG: hypothetical protein R2880_07055 [Deinococcales bacterium]
MKTMALENDRSPFVDLHLEASPVKPSERLDLIDVLRGFALLGILLVNMLHFSGPHVW